MASSVLKLMHLRLAILVNGFLRARRRAKIGYIAIGAAILAMIGFILFVSIALLAFLRSPRMAQNFGDVTPFLESIPSVIVTVAALGILLTSFSVLLQVLYLSGDMDFLMSAPLSIRAVFVAKLVQAVLPNFGILCILTLPLLFGLGISGGYYFLYYPFVVLALAAISLAAAALASLLVMVVARFFPPRRVAEVLGFVIGTTFFILTQSGRFADVDFDKVNDQQLSGLLSIAERFNYAWSPLAWAGRGLVELGKGEWLPASALLAASLIFTGVIFCVALATSEQLYYTGWASLKNNRRKSIKKTRNLAVPADGAISFKRLHPLNRLIPLPVFAVLVKDLRLLRRDLANLSSLVFPMILGVVYSIGMLRSGGRMPEGRGNAPPIFIEAGNIVMNYADVALTLFLGAMLVSNLGGFSFSREGKNYWLLKASPLDARQLLTAKFLVGYLPSVMICSIFVVVLGVLKHAPPFSIAVSLISIWMMMAGLTGIYLALGTKGARFVWENPSQIQRTVGCMGFLMGVCFLLACFMIFVAPAILADLLHLPIFAGQLAGLFLCGVASALAVIIPLVLVKGRVATLAEDP